jgi:hypothetical protein
MHCAVVPTLGQTSRHRFVDTGQELLTSNVNAPNHVYVSEPAVGEMAKLLGWTPPEEVAKLEDELAVATVELERVVGEAAALRARFAAIDVLESEGFTARKKPGRPKVAA